MNSLNYIMNRQTIKKMFLDYNGRLSREAFAVAYGSLFLFFIIATPILSKLCTLLLSMFLTFLLTVIYVIYAIYAICVVVIKRLHDLNLPGWYCISVFTPLAVLLIPYLVLAKGNPEINKYGEPPLPFKGQSFVLFGSYAAAGLYVLAWIAGLFLYTQVKDIKDNPQKLQNILSKKRLVPKKIKEELKNNVRAVGSIYIDGQFQTYGVAITKDRILVQKTQKKQIIENALSQGKQAQIYFSDNSSSNITRLITADDSLIIPMSVFEIDQPIGTPSPLSVDERTRKILERMNAF